MKDFDKIREELVEEVTFRSMKMRVKYASTPGRPSKRVTKPTREMILNLRSYENKASASKDRGMFNRAKEVWDATLFSMDTRLFVRELRLQGAYMYFLSFDGVLPYMAVEVVKKIPKNDWQYFSDEYQYATYYTFKKRFVEEEHEGNANLETEYAAPAAESDSTAEIAKKIALESGIDPSYVSKQTGKSEMDKTPRSFSMSGGNSKTFFVETYHKGGVSQYVEYEFDDGSIFTEWSSGRYGSFDVQGPSLRQVMKKLKMDGDLDERLWKDIQQGDVIEPGKYSSGPEVIKGPNGIIPDSEAYDDWEEMIQEMDRDIWWDHEASGFAKLTSPYKITDEDDGVTIIFDPNNEESGRKTKDGLQIVKDYDEYIPSPRREEERQERE